MVSSLERRVNKLEGSSHVHRRKFCHDMARLFRSVGVPMTAEEFGRDLTEDVNSYADLLRGLPAPAEKPGD